MQWRTKYHFFSLFFHKYSTFKWFWWKFTNEKYITPNLPQPPNLLDVHEWGFGISVGWWGLSFFWAKRYPQDRGFYDNNFM